MREGIRSLLEARDDIAVVGEASTGKETVDKVAALRPDIALLDISLSILNGLEATRQIRKSHPDCKVLVLTMHENTESVQKKSAATQLFDVIQAVFKGKAFFSPSISKMLLEDYMKETRPPDEPLSLREKEVLQLVAEKYANRGIAELLHISVKTVYGHKDKIRNKLGIQDMAGLIRYAIQTGIINVEKME